MNQEWKSRWLARLRDPDSKQAFSTMHDGCGFCVIGHLLELCADAGIVKRDPYAGKMRWIGTKVYINAQGHEYVDLWRQVEEETGYKYWPRSCILVAMNDNQRKTLPQIADWIQVAI